MTVTTSNPGPYAPSSAVLDIVQRYRSRGLTKPFTGEVLARAGVSDSLIPRTIQTLQTLELTDAEGNPTETLESLRRVPESEFKSQLAAWLRAVYADVFAFVEPTDDELKIRDAFRAYNPVGQQSRMVALFVGLCRAAGLRTDETESKPRPHARKVTVGEILARGRAREIEKGTTPPINIKSLPPAMVGMLQNLPPSGKWTREQRDRFIAAFIPVLDFCIYVVPGDTEDENA